MEKIKILAFLKFGKEKDIIDLIDNGTIYCNTIESFRKTDDGSLRGDGYEGTFKITNYTPGGILRMKFQDGKEMQFNAGDMHFREFYSEVKGNIYCLTAIREQDIIQTGSLKFDMRLARFGSHFLFIEDIQKFYDLLISTFERNNLIIRPGFVKYYNKKKINGEIDFFYKPDDFEYQKEFRILIQNKGNAPIKIQLGSLRDFAQIFETKDLALCECKLYHYE